MRPNLKLSLALSILVAIAAAVFAQSSAAAPQASNGFTSVDDGYSFSNYGNEAGVRDLTPRYVKRMFGPGVCSRTEGKTCVLTPEAQEWMEATNKAMSDGHCYGFATTAQRFFEDLGWQPSRFGAPTTPQLQIQDNPQLQSYIAYAWAMQGLPAVQENTTNTSPRGVFRELGRDLRRGDAKWVLTIYDDGGGHAITPIAVDSQSKAKKRIAVYDNNHPGQTRYVHINTKKNTWQYQLAPGEQYNWSGDAKTKSIQLSDPRPGFDRQPCFICAKSGKAGPGKLFELRMTADPRSARHGSLVATDRSSGRSTGYDSKGHFNRIRGAHLTPLATGALQPWRTDTPPILKLPTRNAYTVDLGPTSNNGAVREDIALIGRGQSVGVEGLRLAKGESAQLRVAKKLRTVAFRNLSGSAISPTLQITNSAVRGGTDYRIEIDPVGVNHRAAVGARFDAKAEKLRITNRGGAKRERVEITLTVYTAKGTGQKTKTLVVPRGGGKTLNLSE